MLRLARGRIEGGVRGMKMFLRGFLSSRGGDGSAWERVRGVRCAGSLNLFINMHAGENNQTHVTSFLMN